MTLQIRVNVCDTVQLLAGLLQYIGESWKKLNTSNVFLSFIVNQEIGSNNNPLFVGQLYEDKSLALHVVI